MKNQALLLASMIVGGLSLAATGCILGSNPNENSMTFGGVAGTNGTAGNSGNAGTTGAGGSSLDTLAGMAVATFDTTTESFAFSTYDEPTNLAVHSTAGMPTLDYDSTDQSPSGGGSLKIFAPYSGANQYVDIQSPAFTPANYKNWAGGKLHVRVKVDTGSTFMGQIEPYVDTTSTFAFVGGSQNIQMTPGWHDYSVALDTAMTRIAGYDLHQVVLFGVHIGSGGGGANQAPVTFHIDSFTIEGTAAPAPPDAGSDTAAAADASGN
jgi:hypothetical protein